MRTAGLVLMPLLLLTSFAQADESRRRPGLAPTAAAKQVAEAFDAKDEKTIAELANLEIPNPWFVAEMLLLDQRKDAAVAFAAVTTDKDAAALVAYVGGREVTADDRAAWPAIHAVRSARTVEAVQQILATLASVTEKTKGVTRMRAFESWAGGLQALRRFEESLARYDDAARAARDLTWRFGEQVMLTSAGLSAARRSDHDAAFTRWQAALDLARAREDERNINTLLGNIGTLLRRAGRFREAVPLLEEVLRRQAALGARAKPATRGNVLNALGLCHWRLGDLDKAIALMEQAIAVRTEIGHAVGVAGSTENIGSILMEKGDYLAARKKMDEARAVYERLGSIRHLATHLANSGALYLKQDELEKAKAELARAVELSDQAGNRAGAALTLANLAAAHQVGGEIPEALALFEQVLARQEQLGVDLDRASTLGSLGSLHMALGDHETARVMLEKSLALREPLGDKRGVANVRGNLGLLWYRQHEYAKAAIELEKALAVGEEIQDKPGNVARHANLGNAYSRLERHEDAARQLTQSLALATELGNPSAIASAHGALAHARFDREDYPTAREHFEKALAKAREAGDPDHTLAHLSGLARTSQYLGDKRAAVRYAREAVALLGQLASGLAQEQGAMTRERHAPVFETGILSAAQLGDTDALCYFLESGRAGTLLEYLGGRDRLRSFILPDALREALAQARGAEAAAARALERAQGRRNLQLVRSRRTKLAEAREAVRGVVQRIQREAKAAAHVLYPEALPTAKIQAALADGDALVLYGVCDPDTVALVLTREAARIVPLGSTEAIAAAVGDLSLTDTSVDPTRALAALAARVVEPLGLDAKTKRLLVSPAGVLSEVPFGLLHDADVAYLPSGTTADVLAVQREVRGEGASRSATRSTARSGQPRPS